MDAGHDAGEHDATVRDASTRDADEHDASTRDASVSDAGDLGANDAAVDPAACTRPFSPVPSPASAPPFAGTSFITDDLLTDADPTSFVDLSYLGVGSRSMFDRRSNSFQTLNAHLFAARFGSTKTIEVQVNPEFSSSDAEVQARRYAAVVGRLPGFLLRDVQTVWIHRGMNPFGGGNQNLLIHTDQGEAYAAAGTLEEIFVHEATHTSLDADHATAPRWAEARAADGVALSTYARDNVAREDLAESLGPYLALRFRRDRLDGATAAQIEATIPNRMQYFDCVGLTLAPLR